MFTKILIANRGEIACRVARTANRMGIATVAIYSEVDAGSMHVKACDEAYLIGPAAAADSYLNIEKVLDIAKQSNCDAIHPGYGFLSENAYFAQACEDAKITFIGPPVSAIHSMGSKSNAKQIMAKAGVPLVPGYHGDDQSVETLKTESNKVGFPQLIKATAGGGGKGMRVVNHESEFEALLTSCCREAKASFGDEKVLIERYLTSPRHIEFQVFADSHGKTVHVFERDCSIQRRHQKIIEEAPAPGMNERLRAEMGKAAVDAAKAINYEGAGTVEFLLDSDDSFYFMEMNTRLQVEHPVTEMITGQDLVEWQLLVASGEPLPVSQEGLKISGHSFEARIYAESPENDFLPATGTLEYLQTPSHSQYVRVDTGVTQGDEVSIHYDPMIAKLIVWDKDRDNALRQMKTALQNYKILGVNTNIVFLSHLIASPAFSSADFDTGFIEKHNKSLFVKQTGIPNDVVALVCLHQLLLEKASTETARLNSNDPYSPWGSSCAWQMNLDSNHELNILSEGEEIPVQVFHKQSAYVLLMNEHECIVSGTLRNDAELIANINGRQVAAVCCRKGHSITVLHEGQSWTASIKDPYQNANNISNASGSLVAPMPGTVVVMDVNVGDSVKEGDVLAVVEAMKMEHAIVSPTDSKISEIYYAVGDQIEGGAELLSLENVT